MRLNKYLAQCGVASRRSCDKIISSGRVSVNGMAITAPATQIGDTDLVTMDNRAVQPAGKKTFMLLHKPKGYITSAKDTHGRATVFDLVKTDKRLFSVGRLDFNTEGLLLLTDDGEVAYRLLHPRYKVVKKYRVTLDRDVSEGTLAKCRAGVQLEDGKTAPCEVSYVAGSDERNRNAVEMTLHEGRKRQIKRMFRTLGFRVVRLQRTGFGPLHLGDLPVGKWRYLSAKEIELLDAEIIKVPEDGRSEGR